MGSRLQLQVLLEEILESENVYFQTPPNLQMKYPAIVYHRDRANVIFADDAPYRLTKRYQLTFISLKPDSDVFDRIAALPMCTHERFFAADNLNHDVFTIYF